MGIMDHPLRVARRRFLRFLKGYRADRNIDTAAIALSDRGDQLSAISQRRSRHDVIGERRPESFSG
jgi:hypothetical protein